MLDVIELSLPVPFNKESLVPHEYQLLRCIEVYRGCPIQANYTPIISLDLYEQ